MYDKFEYLSTQINIDTWANFYNNLNEFEQKV